MISKREIMNIKVHDDFCSLCHGWCSRISGEKIECSKCVRSYHIECAQVKGICLMCYESRIHEESWKWKSSETRFKKIVGALSTNPRFEKFHEFMETNLLINSMGLKRIEEKAHQNIYRSPHELIVDIKWIYHNTCILYAYDSRIVSDASELMKFAKLLVGNFIKRYGQIHLIESLAIEANEAKNVDHTLTSDNNNETLPLPTIDHRSRLQFSCLMMISFGVILILFCIFMAFLQIIHCA